MTDAVDSTGDMEPVAPIEDWNISPGSLQLGDLIGEGSFGKVYKAKYLGIDVAVKKIMESVEQASEFEHEVAVLKYVEGMRRKKVSGHRKSYFTLHTARLYYNGWPYAQDCTHVHSLRGV